ncbi:MAG: hypothetical protein DMG71_04845 [Acidobacteria bacterium]|nr:MAG: hypothetical protein DMG71_04845 [Acidobacteriota bacterium]
MLTIVGCGGRTSSGRSNPNSNPIATSGANVQPIAVNSGPLGNYANGVFTPVTICVPGTSNCQTISGVLVDTGSYGLRLLSSAVSLSLPQQTTALGTPIAECAQFSDGVTWGPVKAADVKLASEQANSVPIQIIGDPKFSAVPSSCSSKATPMDTLQTLAANGILGVGPFRQDCGDQCALPVGAGNPGVYFQCPSSTCPQDNTGVIVELPAVGPAGAPSVNGSLVFGIDTQSNNALGSAKVFTLNSSGNFTTIYPASGGTSYPNSFIDSGSNGLFFGTATPTLPACSKATGFYCPSSTQNFSATQQGRNGTSNTVNFSVANAESLNSNNFAFDDLAGPNANTFDWGLPFFFGRNVFTAIESQPTSAGAGPFWAY